MLTINEVLDEGKDLDNFLWETIKYIKDILLFQTCGTLLLYNENELSQIKAISEKTTKDRLLSLIYNLSELANSIKWSTQKQIVFEAGIIKVCTNITNLEDRIKTLEDKIENFGAIHSNTGSLRTSDPYKSQKAENVTPKIASTQKQENVGASIARPQKAENVIAGNNVTYWAEVVNNLKKNGKIVLYTNLINTIAKEINDLTLGIEFPNGLTAFGKTVIEQPENMQELVKQVSMQAGKEMRIKLIDAKANTAKEDTKIDNGLASLGIDINIIDN